MNVYWIDPLRDPRWTALVEYHPAASIFHTRGWLEALQRTYGFVPAALTTSPPGQALSDGIVFCRIKSWLTGRRLVSLPFSDHCEPLADNLGLLSDLFPDHWKYVELRPLGSDLSSADLPPEWQPTQSYYFHKLDLNPSLERIFAAFHKDGIQRKIRRAEREGLRYECGRSQSLLKQFYRLQVITRRRQKLPPQPLAWFRNLIDCLGDTITIWVASKGDLPVASILTLAHKKIITYKYGCSDARFHNLGGTQLLFWQMIQESKEQGMLELDMGRSDLDNAGLITFKDRWGTKKSILTYLRCPSANFPRGLRRDNGSVKKVFAHMPGWLLIAVGRVLYPHIG